MGNNNNNDEISEYKQFTCYKCERVPEILKLHKYQENIMIELKCKYHDYLILNFDNYKENLENFILSCNKCQKKMQSKKDIKYCFECQKKLCSECLNDYDERHKREHRIIVQEDKNNKCLQHYNIPITSYCLDCEENICKKDKGHDDHKTEKLDNKEALNNIEIIENKNYILNKIINDYGNFRGENKNIHLECMLYNYWKLIKQNEIKPKEFDIIKNRLEKLENNKKNIIKSLEEKNIKIKIEEENKLYKKLYLEDKGNKKINNEEFKLITKLYYKNLKEINLSDNQISDIDCLNQMILPHLESLNMSKNQIQKIDPIIDCIKLKKIDFSHNRISDIKCLSEEKLPYLEFLNMSNNKIDSIKELSDYKKIKEIDFSNNCIINFFSKVEFLNLKKINLIGNSINRRNKIYSEFEKKYKDIIIIDEKNIK